MRKTENEKPAGRIGVMKPPSMAQTGSVMNICPLGTTQIMPKIQAQQTAAITLMTKRYCFVLSMITPTATVPNIPHMTNVPPIMAI